MKKNTKKVRYKLGADVFMGEDASRRFLDPSRFRKQCLELRGGLLNPFEKQKVRFVADLLLYTPHMNSKLIAVWGICQSLLEAGELNGVNTFSLASSGNSGWTLSNVAKLFGVEHTFATMPIGVPDTKSKAINMAGGRRADDSVEGETPIGKAKRLSKQDGWLYFDQYGHKGNKDAFRLQALKLWKEMDGSMTVSVVPVGTGGTVTGYSEGFGPLTSDRSRRIKLVGVVAGENGVIPGARNPRQLQEVGYVQNAGGLEKWSQKTVDALIGGISLQEAMEFAIMIFQDAHVPVGLTSGLALAGTHQAVKKWIKDGSLDKLRNDEGEVVVMVTMPDSFHFYTGDSSLGPALQAVAERRRHLASKK